MPFTFSAQGSIHCIRPVLSIWFRNTNFSGVGSLVSWPPLWGIAPYSLWDCCLFCWGAVP
jgi:hypothetical protein